MKIAVFCPHKLIPLLKNTLFLIHNDIVFVYEDQAEPLEGEYNFKYNKDCSYGFLEIMSVSMAVVYGWNYLIPENVLNKIDFFNVHASLLPQYRGPYPVVFQLLHKEKKIGVTIHKMNRKFDSGEIFIQEYIEVNYDRLSFLEVSIFRVVKRNMIKLIRAFLTNEIDLIPQQKEGGSYYSKNDMLTCLNGNVEYKDFVWMNEIFKIYKPFKVKINGDIYIIDDYSCTSQDGYHEYFLKDCSVYLKLVKETYT